MSTEQNVAAVTRIYEAFGRGDIPYIINQLADDVSWKVHMEPVVPWSGDYAGRVSVPRFFEAIGTSVDVLGFTPQEFVAQGDTVVSLGTFASRSKATGKSAESRWAFVWKLKDGRVVSYEQFHTPGIANIFS